MASVIFAIPSFAIAAVDQVPTASQPTQDEVEEAEKNSRTAAQVEDIVVTGSRLRRSEFSSSQPISVITSEQSALEGTIDTTEILQSSTTASTASQINNYFTGYVNAGGAGANTISLRGLGANRTLVLINGRRLGPAGIGGQVGPADLNTIPSGQIERVEILTDGASSIYGSDAVAGVINIITKSTQAGGHLQAQATVPFESGGEEFRIDGSYGWNNGRGYLTVGGEYYERKPLLFGDRDAFRCPQDREYLDPALKIRGDVIDPATGDYKCASGPTNQVFAFRYNGATRPSLIFQRDPTAIKGGGLVGCDEPGWRFQAGGEGTLCAVTAQSTDIRRSLYSTQNLHVDRYDSRTAISPVKRYGFTAFAGYDLTANTEVFGELLFNRRESSQTSWQQLFPNVKFDHPDYPFAQQHVFGPLLDYATVVAYVPQDNEQEINYTRAVAGIRGKIDIGRGFDWELAAQYSRSDGKYSSDVYLADRIYATSGYHEGRDVKGETAVKSGFAAGANLADFAATGCATAWLFTADACPAGGVNWFSESFLRDGVFSPEEAAFISARDTGSTLYTHAYVEGLVSGELFDLPAGPVGVAVGFQYRQEELDDIPGKVSRNRNAWGLSSSGRTRGKDTIKEVFAEAELPLLKDLPLADSLTLNVSGRYSDYDSYGDNSTYKIGANWAITSEYRLRASYGTAFRAPALYELYLADLSSFAAQTSIDPCVNWAERTDADVRANCEAAGIPKTYNAAGAASARVLSGGGAGKVEAETAETTSIGLIWTPSFADLNVALDYFKVTVKDQVAQYGAGGIVQGCYGFGGYRDKQLCTLFERAPAGAPNEFQIIEIRNAFINIASQMSEGLDLNIRYNKSFALGDLTLAARSSYILNWDYELVEGSGAQSQLDYIGYPEWVANLSAQFKHKDWTFFWNVDITPETTNVRSAKTGASFGQQVFYDTTADESLYHNFSVRKQADKWTFIAGINNVFDENAPWTSASGGSRGAGNVALASQYDYLGRRAFLSVSRSF